MIWVWHTITSIGQNYYFFHNFHFVHNIWQIVSGDDIKENHSFAIFISTGQRECSVVGQNLVSKYHNFLIFQPIFIRFSLLCLNQFLLFVISRNLSYNHVPWFRALNNLSCRAKCKPWKIAASNAIEWKSIQMSSEVGHTHPHPP